MFKHRYSIRHYYQLFYLLSFNYIGKIISEQLLLINIFLNLPIQGIS